MREIEKYAEKLESIEKLIEKEERQLKRYQDRLLRTE